MSQSDIRNHALWLLGSREHSTYEMRQKLSRKGFEEDSITQVIEDLTSLNYLSDQRFAEAFCRSKSAKPLGKQRILNELKQKGISEEQAKQALCSLDVDWFELALNLKQRKFGDAVERDYQKKSKQMRYLLYRGFGYDEVRYAIEEDCTEQD